MGKKGEIEALSRDKQTNLHKGRYQEVAEICNYLGELLTREERYEDAVSEHETELEMCIKTKDSLGQAIANRKIGECYCAMGEYEKALRFQQKHLTIARELGNDLEQQRAYATLGRTYMCRAEGTNEVGDSLKKAKEAFNASLNFAVVLKEEMEAGEYSLMVGRLYLNLGILSEMGGNMLRALKYLKDARAMMKESKLQEEELKCVSLMGAISANLGDLDAAEDLSETACNLARQLKNKNAIFEAIFLRACVFFEAENFSKSRHFLKKIVKKKPRCEKEIRAKAKKMLKILPKIKNNLKLLPKTENLREKMRIFDFLADDFCSVECFFSGLKYYKLMLETGREAGRPSAEIAAIFVSLGQTSVDLKNYSDAIRFSFEELKFRNDAEQRCRTWLNIADYTDKLENSEKNIEKNIEKKLEKKTEKNNNKKNNEKNDEKNSFKKNDEENFEENIEKNSEKTSVAEFCETAISEAERSGNLKLLLKCLRYQQAVYRGLKDVEKVEELEDRIQDIASKGDVTDGVTDDVSDGESETEVEERSPSPETEGFSSLTESDDDGFSDEDKATSSAFLTKRREYKLKRNEKGETLLHTAVINGNLKRVKQLLKEGHPINVRDNCGWLPLHEAANHGHLDIASFLIENNAALNDKGEKECHGLTPLLDAAHSGNVDMVRLLFKKGALPTSRDADGMTVVDALLQWKKESFTEKEMDRETEADFNELIGSLQAAMIQAGMRPEELHSHNRKRAGTSRQSQSTSATKERAVKRPLHQDDEATHSLHSDMDMDGAGMYKAAINGLRGTSFRRRQEKRKRAPSPPSPSPPPSPPSYSLPPSYPLPSTPSVSHPSRSSHPSHPSHPSVRSEDALIRSEEFVGDDWLIEDVGGGSVEGRVSRHVAGILYTSTTRQMGEKRKPSSFMKTTSKTSLGTSKPLAARREAVEMDVECIDITNPSRSGVDSFMEEDDDWTTTQPSHPPPPSPALPPLPPSQTAIAQPLPAIAQSVGRLRIRIEDLVIIVPVTAGQERTVGWLAEEAAIRYSELKGMKPLLQMKTNDGAVLSAHDLLKNVLHEREEVVGVAMTWHNPPVEERYSKASAAVGVSVFVNVKECLRGACQTGVLNAADLFLSVSMAGPLLRSLQFQSNIRQLNFEGNSIGDSGFRILLDALPSLPNITHLSLACTDLTTLTLDALQRTLTTPPNAPNTPNTPSTPKCLQCLSHLDLSHNDFSASASASASASSGEEAVGLLSDIISQLPCLTSLALEDCSLNFLDRRENALRLALATPFRLRSISLAWNDIGVKGVGRLLAVLPSSLKCLNLSGCLSLSEGRLNLSECLSECLTPPSLETLILADSQLSPETFPDILDLLRRFPSLRTLSLSRNRQLKEREIQSLLETVRHTDTVRQTDTDIDIVRQTEVSWTSLDISGIPAVNGVIPLVLRTIETTSQLREFFLTVEDAEERKRVMHCWTSAKGGSVRDKHHTLHLCSL